jgi:hypothetical protein
MFCPTISPVLSVLIQTALIHLQQSWLQNEDPRLKRQSSVYSRWQTHLIASTVEQCVPAKKSRTISIAPISFTVSITFLALNLDVIYVSNKWSTMSHLCNQ